MSRLATAAGLKILPEARRLVGLDPGEPILHPVLVPSTAWCSNLRNHLPDEVWTELSRGLSHEHGRRCEYCGRKGKKWPTECHELWDYGDELHTQTLSVLVTLCPDCHSSYHLGYAQISGRLEEALGHLALVNGWDLEKARETYGAAMRLWVTRSTYEWSLTLDRPGTMALSRRHGDCYGSRWSCKRASEQPQ